LQKGRRDKDQNRRLALPEKAARGLTHETGGEHERHREQSISATRSNVENSRQDDQEQRQRGSVDRQMREAAAEKPGGAQPGSANSRAPLKAKGG
jgi:hypothetical protein